MAGHSKLPDKAWGASFNLNGLYKQKPFRVTVVRNAFKDRLWSSDGDVDFEEMGLNNWSPGCYKFCSESKEEVAAWISGAQCVLKAIARMA